jgi:diguanylate cyclase (GGDEF)-like protein
MFKRVVAIGTAPALIILFMLFLVHLQPPAWGRLVNEDFARTGRIVLDLLPYGLALMGIGIGLRFRTCGVLIAMLSLGFAYRVLTYQAAGLDAEALHRGIAYTVPALLVPTFLLAAWTQWIDWRISRGLGALLASAGWCLALGGGAWGLWGRPATPGALLESLVRQTTAAIQSWRAGVGGLGAISDRLPVAIDGGAVVWPVCLLLLVQAVRHRSPVLAGLGGSLAVTAPQVAGQAPPGLVYTAATLIVLVSVLETVFKHAYRDGLTDLPARRRLDDTLRSLGRRYAIAMLDVDHFKRFNDRYGHATGDEVLKMIAARAGRIRGGRPFRYGGEEFAVVFTGRAAERAEAAMEAFRRDLARTPFVIRKPPRPARTRKGPSVRNRTMGSRQKARVTVSIGLAAADRRRKAADVLKAADKALYRAKRSGRNRLCREAGARRTTAGPAVKFERKQKR